jgi:hypothetical protein
MEKPEAVINPVEYEFLLKVKLKFPGPQNPAGFAAACASDAQTSIAADTTNINATTVEVEAFVPAGSGE